MASTWKRSRMNRPAVSALTGRSPPTSRGELRLALASLADASEQDGELVEEAHREGECEQADRVGARGDDGSNHEDDHDGIATELPKFLAVENADELEEDEEDRELEASAERQHHVHDQREVFLPAVPVGEAAAGHLLEE